jgi:hypothetical protein
MILQTFQPGMALIAANARPIWGRFDHERPRFDSADVWLLVSASALLIAMAVITYRSSRRRKQEFTHDSPRRLFRELCRRHCLPLASRRLLKRLAAAHGVSDPAILFVNSTHFDAASLPVSLAPMADQIRTLRNQLFC